MDIVVCALTSNDTTRLERLIVSAVNSVQHCSQVRMHGLVVCNTLDEDYPRSARSIAYEHGWEFVQTESNGRPGKGKNSALKYFAENYPSHYMLLLMDGDDFLYESALGLLEKIATRTGCDVLGLQTNDIVERLEIPGYSGVRFTVDNEVRYLYSWWNVQGNLYAMPEHYQKVVRTNRLGDHSTPDRIILFSHRAAKTLRCSEQLPVYEDYILSLNAQKEYLTGNLKYFNTSTTHIYVYDKTNESSTCRVYDKEANGDWSVHEQLFKQEVADLEPYLEGFHASEVPFIYVDHSPKDIVAHKLVQIGNLMSEFPTG